MHELVGRAKDDEVSPADRFNQVVVGNQVLPQTSTRQVDRVFMVLVDVLCQVASAVLLLMHPHRDFRLKARSRGLGCLSRALGYHAHGRTSPCARANHRNLVALQAPHEVVIASHKPIRSACDVLPLNNASIANKNISSTRCLHGLLICDTVSDHHNIVVRVLSADPGDGLRLALGMRRRVVHVKALQSNRLSLVIQVPAH
mmetsp:Transcript_7026/g.18894  ORF Transcript_7026/g.18894 Transcript_7026/m.18894 type:complete len:201 (+) Transcript_7026:1070-1672(+)